MQIPRLTAPPWRGFLMLAASVLAAGVWSPALGQMSSQSNCTDRSSALSYLAKSYKEQPVAMGLASSGGVVEVLANKDGTSWSIIVTQPSGITCLVASGENWEDLPLAPISTERL